MRRDRKEQKEAEEFAQMGIRETINQKKNVALASGTGLVVIAIALIVWGNRNDVPGPAKSAYYSDDDGKTYFADDANKISPFDHNGKSACRAYVYRCGSGQPFVLYLERYKEGVKAKLVELNNKPSDFETQAAISELRGASIEIKKPGDKTWVSPNSPAANEIIIPKCPDGGVPRGIYP